MRKYKLYANKNITVDKIADTMFSSFIEHLGRAVYDGIYNPDHITSDENGFRQDVIDYVKAFNLSLVRYPGGNFVSNYNWEDGIGPKNLRPVMKDEAWKQIEPNQVGLDEFMIWCDKANVGCMMAVNLGTGTTDSAKNLIEYANSDKDGKYANLRRANGHEKPYNIKYWCLGNEMDGDWQIGHLPAKEYAEKAREAAIKMKEIDPNAKFIACGSSIIDMPTFPEWDRIVCENLYDVMDYLSVHQYFYESTTEEDFYASYLALDSYVNSMKHTIAYVKAKNRSNKNVYLCFDEFNIWYNNKKLTHDYQLAPQILEENQSLKDTIVFGGMINSLLNNCDVVKIACLAQLVNVIAPIYTEPNTPKTSRILKNAIYYPYELVSKYCRGGEVLDARLDTDDHFLSRYGEATYLSSSIVKKDDEVIVLMSNTKKEDIEVNLELSGFNNLEVLDHVIITGDDLNARNTFDHPYDVVPTHIQNKIKINGTNVTINLNKNSWNLIRIKY